MDVTLSSFLKGANCGNFASACAIYSIAAARGGGALSAFVVHHRFWKSKPMVPEAASYGDPTPFRGMLILDPSKILTPIYRCISEKSCILDPRTKTVVVDLGFKIHHPSTPKPCQVMCTISTASKEISSKEMQGGGGASMPCSYDMCLSDHGYLSLPSKTLSGAR